MRLSEPLVLRNGQTLPNRLAKAAMTEGLADAKGRPSEALITLFRTWGQGGAGLLITGNVLIDHHHLERAGNVLIDAPPDPLMSNLLRRWAEAAKAQGARVWMQL